MASRGQLETDNFGSRLSTFYLQAMHAESEKQTNKNKLMLLFKRFHKKTEDVNHITLTMKIMKMQTSKQINQSHQE